MLYTSKCLRTDFMERYAKDFNDYMIKVLYPNLKTAQEYLEEEK